MAVWVIFWRSYVAIRRDAPYILLYRFVFEIYLPASGAMLIVPAIGTSLQTTEILFVTL